MKNDILQEERVSLIKVAKAAKSFRKFSIILNPEY